MTATTKPNRAPQSAGKATSLSLVGAVATTVANFGTAILVARASTSFAGIFFTATALISILGNGSSLGSMTGVVFFTPKGLDEEGQPVNVRPILKVALIPVAALSSLLGLAVALGAPWITSVMGADQAAQHTDIIRYAAPAIPAWAVMLVLLGATRALGTMTPHVGINQIFKPVAQIALLGIVFATSATAIPKASYVALAWAGPIVVSAILAAIATVRLGGWTSNGEEAVTAKRFWRYTRPRSVSVALQSLLERVDVIIISRLTNDDIAGVYGTLTRYITAGNYLIFSVAQATSPSLRRAIANKKMDVAQSLLFKVTSWMVLITWPYFIFLAIKSEGAARLLDNALVDGKTALTILALGMTVSALAGPIDMALLMLGRSRRSLFSTFIALVADVSLAWVLVPRYELIGAAIAWVVAVAIQNLLNSYFVYDKSRLRSIGNQPLIAGLGAALCFGIPAFLTSQSLLGMMLSGAIGVALYAAWVLAFADQLYLDKAKKVLVTKLSLR